MTHRYFLAQYPAPKGCTTPVKKRVLVFTLAGGIAGLFFIPYITTVGGNIHSLGIWLGWSLGSMAVTGVAAWLGTKMADRAGLPMPFLRPWELGQSPDPNERRFFVRTCIAIGGVFGLLAVFGLHALSVPGSQVSYTIRESTFPFGAIVVETVAHLFLMSGLILFLKRNTFAILVSAFVFLVMVHAHSLAGGGASAYIWGMNYALGVATGWVYSRYGIEGAVLTHAVAAAIFLGIN